MASPPALVTRPGHCHKATHRPDSLSRLFHLLCPVLVMLSRTKGYKNTPGCLMRNLTKGSYASLAVRKSHDGPSSGLKRAESRNTLTGLLMEGVSSRAQKGLGLWPMLFDLSMNDLELGVSCVVARFAQELLRTENTAECKELQEDLFKLGEQTAVGQT